MIKGEELLALLKLLENTRDAINTTINGSAWASDPVDYIENTLQPSSDILSLALAKLHEKQATAKQRLRTPLERELSENEPEVATLRDQFAMAALNALHSNPAKDYDFDGAARDAYRQADAMLAVREVGDE